MIHDVLLSCLSLYSKRLPIEEFLISDGVPTFMHPCEKVILKDIITIINQLRDVAKFTKIYGSSQYVVSSGEVDTDGEPLQTGLYLKAFANGIDQVLEEYFADIGDLERRYLQNPSYSLMFIYQKLQVYEPLALFLRKLIRGIRMNKLHGCAIMQYLQKHNQHGDRRISRAIKIIQTQVTIVFLKQLTHWILYAKIVDSYGEFFIQCVESRSDSPTADNDKHGTSISGKHITATTISDLQASTCGDIWRYEIAYNYLPKFFSSAWAEKVLFIGQTVLIFKMDANNMSKNAQIWNECKRNILDSEDSLWNEKEHIYFGKIQAIQNDEELNVSHYERVINEIKSHVTTRLSEIAINQADLMQQLKLIKDFYMMGRGELFLEFIKLTHVISKERDNENKMRDYVKAFESAANAVGVSEDLEKFSLSVYKPDFEPDDTYESSYLQILQLKYKINWPLHLLFSPKALERYNILFRHLLLIKKMQYELHMIWCTQTSESKKERQNYKMMLLRNQLMFFMDNLQYYIQVDVLESQYSILINTILSKADFEEIQKAHTLFQANVMSLCFLLCDEDAHKLSLLQSTVVMPMLNPVYVVLNDIFHLCDDFSLLFEAKKNGENIEKGIDDLDEKFSSLIEQLTNLLVSLRASASTQPLSQLLLRLDFNHWFSLKNHTRKELVE